MRRTLIRSIAKLQLLLVAASGMLLSLSSLAKQSV
jgi:hypothetical protein